MDYDTGKSYCANAKVTHRGSCQAQPLQQIPLVGVLLKYYSKIIMLCPQHSCGLPMVFDPHQTIYTARGPSCTFCCQLQRSKAARGAEAALAPWRRKAHCLMCGAGAAAPLPESQTTLYPAGVLVCKKHSFGPLRAHIEKWLPTAAASAAGPLTYDSVAAEVVKFVQLYRQRRRQADEPRQKRLNAKLRSRARNSARR